MTDEQLMDVVRATFEAYEPVPSAVLDGAQLAFRWRDPDAQLAKLAEDCERLPAGVRGGPPRVLTFTGLGLTVEIEVSGTGQTLEIAGQLVPGTWAQIHVRHLEGERVAGTDASGRFVVTAVPAGLTSLLFRLADGTSIVTSWVRL